MTRLWLVALLALTASVASAQTPPTKLVPGLYEVPAAGGTHNCTVVPGTSLRCAKATTAPPVDPPVPPVTTRTLTIAPVVGQGTVDPHVGANQYPDGTVVALTGTPAPGWLGPNWTGDADCADASVTMTANRNCIPTFTQIPGGQEFKAQTWVVKPIPGPFGRAIGSFSKHLRAQYDPPRERFVMFGGDHSGTGNSDGTTPLPPSIQSGRNEMYWYSVRTNTSGVEQYYCRDDGGPQPHRLDEVGATTIAGKLVSLFGFQWPTSAVPCPGSLHGPMEYDYGTRKWSPLAIPLPSFGSSATPNHAFYDTPTDTLIFLGLCGGGPCTWHYSRATGQWLTKHIPLPIGNSPIWDTQPAHDVEARAIYFLPPGRDRLFRFNIATDTVEDLGAIPNLSSPVRVENMPIWDSVSKVLLYPHHDASLNVFLQAYNPRAADGAKWTIEPMPPGVKVRGLHAHFDPDQNVMMIWGESLLFFYRYAERP